MIEQEAITQFQERLRIEDYKTSIPDHYKAMEMAVEALEKQIPKEPITYNGTNRADCPVCREAVRGIKNPFGSYCSGCRQKLDWKEVTE